MGSPKRVVQNRTAELFLADLSTAEGRLAETGALLREARAAKRALGDQALLPQVLTGATGWPGPPATGRRRRE